jgi:hypothetical protein
MKNVTARNMWEPNTRPIKYSPSVRPFCNAPLCIVIHKSFVLISLLHPCGEFPSVEDNLLKTEIQNSENM